MLKLLSSFKGLLVNDLRVVACKQQAGASFHTSAVLDMAWNGRNQGPRSFILNNKTIFEPQKPDEKPRPAVSIVSVAVHDVITITCDPVKKVQLFGSFTNSVSSSARFFLIDIWFSFSLSAIRRLTSNTARRRCGSWPPSFEAWQSTRH